MIYTVSKRDTESSQSETSPVTTTSAETTEASVTTVRETTTVQPSEEVSETVTVTSETEAVSTAATLPPVTQVTVPSASTSASTRPETSVPWWEIVNSAALTG